MRNKLRSLIRQVTFRGICATVAISVILVLAIFYLVVPAPIQGDSGESTPNNSTTTSTDDNQLMPLELQGAFKKAEPAIRTYESFPNRKGRAATLDQLRKLVSTEALAQIEQEWVGPDVNTVTMSVTEVRFEPTPIQQSATNVVVEATVTQKATFANTPAQVYFPIVLATMELRDGKWIVADLKEL